MATKTKKSKKYFLTEDIRDVLFNEDENVYQERIDYLMDYIKEDISRRHLECKITLTETTTRVMTLGNYLTYLILFSPFYYFEEEPTDNMIFDILPIKNFENYLDRVIKVFGIDRYSLDDPEDEDSISITGEIIIEAINKLNKISYIITSAYAPTFSMYQFIELAKRNKRFAEILYEPDKESKNGVFNMKEIVDHTKKICNEIIDIVTSDDENTFKYWIVSGSGVKPEQFSQLFGFIGAKPDLREKIIPKEIASNFAMGLRNAQDFYINSVGCLKALITSHIQVKNSGYFTRKLEMLLNDEYLNVEVEDCGTKHLVPLQIKSEKYLDKLRFRKFSKYPSGKNLQTFEDEEDYSDLIGKTIYLRDPITCACKSGVCRTCYGDLWKVTHSLNIGIIACLIMTNEFTQTMLSTKHLLQAKIKNREFPTAFIKYFDFNRDKIFLKDDFDKIRIEIDGDTFDNDDEDTDELRLDRFTVVDGDKEYVIDSEIPLFLNEELKEDIDSFFSKSNGKYVFKGKDFADYDYVFSHSIENNGLSRTMLLVKDLIDKNKYIEEHTVYELYNRFVELIMESGSTIDFVHISIIIKNMMMVHEGREKFKEKEEPSYTLYKISDAIQYCSESISKPILFEQVKKQLLLDQYGTFNKTGKSSHDELLK